jgi:acyl-CoA reductase-like NAD-dependent aldehyde dehydrogenase
MLVAVGPVAVFGASNFPLAFSTVGGDTAAALAAGCPVVVKGHPSHPGTGSLVAAIASEAIAAAGLPAGTFAHLPAASLEVAEALVDAPAVKAVGFTGSYAGDRAIADRAARAHPRVRGVPRAGERRRADPELLAEHFGPVVLFLSYGSREDLLAALDRIDGRLTGTLAHEGPAAGLRHSSVLVHERTPRPAGPRPRGPAAASGPARAARARPRA